MQSTRWGMVAAALFSVVGSLMYSHPATAAIQEGKQSDRSVDWPAAPVADTNEPMQQIPQTLKSLEAAKAGEYGKLRKEDQHQLNAADREIESLMQSNPDLSTLDEQQRTRLFNAQETILAIVSGLKRSQLVCTYRQNVGTRFRTKQCVSRDMAEAQRRAAKDATSSIQNAGCFEGESGGGGLCGNRTP